MQNLLYLYSEFKYHLMAIKSKNISFQANAFLDNLIEEKCLCFSIEAYKILSKSSNGKKDFDIFCDLNNYHYFCTVFLYNDNSAKMFYIK